jgi:hypothetical protein
MESSFLSHLYDIAVILGMGWVLYSLHRLEKRIESLEQDVRPFRSDSVNVDKSSSRGGTDSRNTSV